MNRRDLLLSATGLLAAGCATPPAPAPSAPVASGPPQPIRMEDARLDAFLSRRFEEQLDRNPEQVTNLGLHAGRRVAQKRQLTDRSAAAQEEERRWWEQGLSELRRFDRNRLSEEARVSYDVADFTMSGAAETGRRFRYGSVGQRPNPYPVSQLGGAYFSVPDFLDNQHSIETREDADAYLARVEAFATVLDQETDRVRRDAAIGVIPPDFVLAKSADQRAGFRAMAPDQTVLVRSIARRAGEKGLGGDYAARATQLVSGPVYAALDRQAAALRELQPRAAHDAGVWRLPDGEAYYAAGLKAYTTTAYTADEVHQIGLDQVAQIQGQIDAILRGQGMTQGSVGERITALSKQPQHVYPNTDPGRAELLGDLNRYIREMSARLPAAFATLPKAAVEVRRVPPYIESGAPGGYYQGAPLDGSRPGAYYINLRDTAEWPRWSLKTLTYHEAVPGHHFQVTLAREAGALPLYRRTQGFSAFNEGWALYSEQVADELGMYQGDPLGRVGFLQSFLFRAVRLVVDTGLHRKRWSREQAIAWMVDNCGEPETSAAKEIERYAVNPGQACSYKIGHTVIARLREEAKAAAGASFDLKAFHDRVLLGGSLPLTVLERRVRERA